jgi:hypothetical protein
MNFGFLSDGGEVVGEVSSIVSGRVRVAGIVLALTTAVALASVPAAFGAGDPLASGTFSFKQSKGFKKQLKRNHVKLTPKKFKVTPGGSNIDPTTGAGTLKIGKITFKKGKKKVVYSNVKAILGANGGKGSIKGNQGKIFTTKGGTVTRNGFGANISGVKVKFFGKAAKKINKALKLGSLRAVKAGTASATEQPKTVAVTGGEALVNAAANLTPGSGTVASKLVGHCIDPLAGLVILPPGTRSGPPTTPVFHFPVTGGTVSPAGTDGSIQTAGGVRLENGNVGAPFGPFQPAPCPDVAPGASTSTSYVDTTNLTANIGQRNIQSNAIIGGTLPGCWAANDPPGCGVFPGDKGVAISQSLDTSGDTVSADPTTHTVVINGAVIKNNATSSLVLNGVFPLAGPPTLPTIGGAENFADGDVFGTAFLTVTTR